MDLPERGPEWRLPPFGDLLKPDFMLPFSAYFLFFRLASIFVKKYTWQSFCGFKQYRLHNLSICFLHSCISGLWSFGFFLMYTTAMFNEVVTWYGPIAAQLPILSVAYFVQDAIDMLSHEWNRWTLELLIHHVATCLAMVTGLLPKRLLLADYWALLMEMNSIFLHARTIMQISNESTKRPSLFRTVIWLNIITFVVFRFVSQILFVRWCIAHMYSMHFCYLVAGLGGPLVFSVINGTLFFRILVSDGFLGEEWKKRAAITRDQEKQPLAKLKNGQSTTAKTE